MTAVGQGLSFPSLGASSQYILSIPWHGDWPLSKWVNSEREEDRDDKSKQADREGCEPAEAVSFPSPEFKRHVVSHLSQSAHQKRVTEMKHLPGGVLLLFSRSAVSDSLWARGQVSLSFTISQRLLKLTSIESEMPSNQSSPLSSRSPPTVSLSQHQGLFQLVLHIRWPEYWSFSISASSEYSGLISFRIDWFDLLAVQGTLKSLLQHHSSKTSILWHSASCMVQLSHPYAATGKNIALTIQSFFVGKVMSLLFNMLSRFVIAFLPRSKHLLILKDQGGDLDCVFSCKKNERIWRYIVKPPPISCYFFKYIKQICLVFYIY